MNFLLSTISNGLKDLEAWLSKPSCPVVRGGTKIWIVWALVTLSLACLIWISGCTPVWAALNDYCVLMDGAWRMYHGQVPHQDFYSVLGPLPLATLSLAFSLFGPSPDSLPKAMVCAGILFSAATLVIARKRLSPAWALVLSVAVLACAAAPAPLGIGDGPPFGFRHQTTYAMFYNRLGWAALIPAFLAILLPPRGVRYPFIGTGESVLLGICLVSVASVKLNFALAVAAVLVWSCFFNWRRRGFWAGLILGSVMALIGYQWVLGNILGYVTDTMTLLKIERTESHLESFQIRIHANRFALTAVSIVSVWIWSNRRSRSEAKLETTAQDYFLAAALFGLALSLFITTFNWERAELPGLIVVVAIAIEAAQRNWPAGLLTDSGSLVRLGIVKALATLLIGAYLMFDIGAIVYSSIWKVQNSHWSNNCEQLDGAFFQAMPVPLRWDEKNDVQAVNQTIHERPVVDFPAIMMTSLQFTRWINDGAALLKSHVRTNDRIFVADWLNPYNLCFGLPPARGGALLWDYRRMLDEKHHPDVERTMAEITLIMVPKVAHLPAQSRFMVTTYLGGEITESQILGESEFWKLYRSRRLLMSE